MSAGAVNRLVDVLAFLHRHGQQAYLIPATGDSFQVFAAPVAGYRKPTDVDFATSDIERAMALFLVEIEPVEWADAPAALATFRLPPGVEPRLRLKTIRLRNWAVEQVSA